MAQKRRGSKRKGTVFITLGLLFITAALLLSAYNYWDGLRAENASQQIADQLMDKIQATDRAEQSSNTAEDTMTSEAETITEAAVYPWAEDPDRVMETMELDGYNYIGILEIPSLGLTLPIMEGWDYSRLKISPCRFSGSYYANNLVIAGHNYARHFSPIKWINPGSDVYFINVNGDVYHYQVDYIEALQPEQVEEMTSGDWDLTLFTCTTGGSARCAVRCSRINNGDR